MAMLCQRLLELRRRHTDRDAAIEPMTESDDGALEWTDAETPAPDGAEEQDDPADRRHSGKDPA
jgi:hypothetical protein